MQYNQCNNGLARNKESILKGVFILFAIFILHLRESELYRYIFGRGVAISEVSGPPVFHIKAGASH